MLSTSSRHSSCNFDTAVEFFVYLFCHTSAYIIVLIGCDRFFRKKYLNRFTEIVKNWKVYVAIVISIFLSFVPTSVGWHADTTCGDLNSRGAVVEGVEHSSTNL